LARVNATPEPSFDLALGLNTGGRVTMSQMSTGLGRDEKRAQPPPSIAPLAVRPSEAARMLSIGISRMYKLLRTGALVSYRDGRSRRVVVSSIHEYVARHVAADPAGWRQIHPRPQERRRRAVKA